MLAVTAVFCRAPPVRCWCLSYSAPRRWLIAGGAGPA